jgi:localization factor PodJL
MARLDTRLAGIERRAAFEGPREKEALEALQARIAGLADQISRTAARSLVQNTELVRALEAVAGKLSQYRSEADVQCKAIDERVCAIASDVDVISGKLDESRTDTERQIRAVDERVAAIEPAVDTLARDESAVVRLEGSLDGLTRRFESTEAEYLNNIERVETRLSRVEANSGETVLDGRLHGIEQTLAEMAKLLEKNARESTGSSEAIPSELRDAGERFEGGRKRDEAPEKPGPIVATPDGEPVTRSPAHDLRATQDAGNGRDHAAQSPIAEPVDSLLTATRPSAPAANSTQPRNAPLSWVDREGAHEATDNSNTRLVLLGAIGLLVLAAIGTGLYLSKTSSKPATFTNMSRAAARPVKAGSESLRLVHYIPAPPTAPQTPVKTTLAHAVRTAAIASHNTARATTRLTLPVPASSTRSTIAPSKPLTPQQRLAALARAGNTKAQELLGLEYVDGDGVAINEAEGAKWLQRAAAQGEAVAAYRLGTLYERGHGVTADRSMAVRWYVAAAKAGNRKAMHNLAVAYAQGTGVQKDLSLAAEWFQRAANLGLADSQFNLAVLYERGLGVRQSLKEAYKWYVIGAAQGDVESRNRMQAIATQLSAGDKTAADKAAADFHAAPLDRAANAPPIAASLIAG